MSRENPIEFRREDVGPFTYWRAHCRTCTWTTDLGSFKRSRRLAAEHLRQIVFRPYGTGLPRGRKRRARQRRKIAELEARRK